MTTLRINWRKLGTELLPAIVQDARTGQVVMLGYMNRKAMRRTTRTGFVTFYSRSKKRLWMKGETSGNVLQFVSASADCDGDAILIRAIPSGPTCHTGRCSCFNADEGSLETLGLLVETIRERSQGNDAQSYTMQLLTGGVKAYGAKVLEEAEEVVRAARSEGKQRTIEEAADLLYHLLVLLRGEGIEIDAVAEELRERRKTPPQAGKRETSSE
ncbi:MAG: bifunctional phosphoribosyl-AMP cyclohydrolase/phosphoribosyl-ATP diphosphatase HisIE [Candidatus Peregrinibacteria bacterium]|nr:bifunctional phosphoribosyl-AMP cyclohydrolase/phosphoribosyl-ATP diphosphatase HisIE [Candidatus Peregrinibacteria bacterium]